MSAWAFIGVMVAAGTLIAFQAPINAQLGQRTGVFEASLVSFSVGTLLAAALALLFGKGAVRGALDAPPWQWIGGLLGMGYVTLAILSVPRVGVTTALVAGLVGQLVTGLAIDHFGLLGVTPHPVGWTRLAGVPLLFLSLWLVQR